MSLLRRNPTASLQAMASPEPENHRPVGTAQAEHVEPNERVLWRRQQTHPGRQRQGAQRHRESRVEMGASPETRCP